MRSVVWFAEVGVADVATVGGKGANLGELTGAGLPVRSMASRYASLVMTKPGGTGRPAPVSSPRFAPLPPTVSTSATPTSANQTTDLMSPPRAVPHHCGPLWADAARPARIQGHPWPTCTDPSLPPGYVDRQTWAFSRCQVALWGSTTGPTGRCRAGLPRGTTQSAPRRGAVQAGRLGRLRPAVGAARLPSRPRGGSRWLR